MSKRTSDQAGLHLDDDYLNNDKENADPTTYNYVISNNKQTMMSTPYKKSKEMDHNWISTPNNHPSSNHQTDINQISYQISDPFLGSTVANENQFLVLYDYSPNEQVAKLNSLLAVDDLKNNQNLIADKVTTILNNFNPNENTKIAIMVDKNGQQVKHTNCINQFGEDDKLILNILKSSNDNLPIDRQFRFYIALVSSEACLNQPQPLVLISSFYDLYGRVYRKNVCRNFSTFITHTIHPRFKSEPMHNGYDNLNSTPSSSIINVYDDIYWKEAIRSMKTSYNYVMNYKYFFVLWPKQFDLLNLTFLGCTTLDILNNFRLNPNDPLSVEHHSALSQKLKEECCKSTAKQHYLCLKENAEKMLTVILQKNDLELAQNFISNRMKIFEWTDFKEMNVFKNVIINFGVENLSESLAKLSNTITMKNIGFILILIKNAFDPADIEKARSLYFILVSPMLRNEDAFLKPSIANPVKYISNFITHLIKLGELILKLNVQHDMDLYVEMIKKIDSTYGQKHLQFIIDEIVRREETFNNFKSSRHMFQLFEYRLKYLETKVDPRNQVKSWRMPQAPFSDPSFYHPAVQAFFLTNNQTYDYYGSFLSYADAFRFAANCIELQRCQNSLYFSASFEAKTDGCVSYVRITKTAVNLDRQNKTSTSLIAQRQYELIKNSMEKFQIP